MAPKKYFDALLQLTWFVSLVKKALAVPQLITEFRTNDFSFKCNNTIQILKWAQKKAIAFAGLTLNGDKDVCDLLSPYDVTAK